MSVISRFPAIPWRKALFFASFLGFLGVTTAHADEYAGSEECADCHEDQAASLLGRAHGQTAFANLSAHGCETCHGAGAAHAANPNKKSLRPTIATLTPGELSAMCQDCHSGGKQSLWMGSEHQTRGVSCVDCHSVHNFQSLTAQLKAIDTSESCFECHQEVRAQGRKMSHHPVREGKIGCNDCHNPHGTATDKLISAASTNEKCYECHAEKQGPYLWEHAPVRENCMSCHTPHGSNHAKLQKPAVPYVCQECHSNTRHPGTIYDAGKLFSETGEPGSSPSNRVFNRACLNCHASIHGSNHPSGPYLGR